MGSLGGGGGGAHAGHDDDSDDSDYHNDEEPRELFAGGEKSALAVEDPRRNDPRRLVEDIVKKARSCVPIPTSHYPSPPIPKNYPANITTDKHNAQAVNRPPHHPPVSTAPA